MFDSFPDSVAEPEGAADELNPQQREAVDYRDGHLLVIAGAGSGKTKTLASRVASLIASGTDPGRILLLTFTRRAAQEMVNRAGRMTDHALAARVWGGTFHAIGNRLLRMYGRALGLDAGFTVMDQGDASDLLQLLRDELNLAAGSKRFPRRDTLAAIYSRTINTRDPLRVVLERHFPWCAGDADGLAELFKAYTARKREHQVLDYDDLLLYWLAAAKQLAPLQDMFQHILVDEYQDTNVLQAELVQSMTPRGAHVTAVGDDAQAIYSFRAATVGNILDFPNRFPGARIVTLEQNYRSTPPILEAANAVMRQASQRYTKDLWSSRPGLDRPVMHTCVDEQDQTDAVCRAIVHHLEGGTDLMRQAVLFRAGHHSDLLEVELSRRNIPYVKYGGLKFLEAAHIKDLLALLRILDNHRDELAWFRVLQLPEGAGPATARKTMLEIEGDWRTFIDRPDPKYTELQAALRDCGSLEKPAAQVERLREYMRPVIVRKYNSHAARTSDLEQLETVASGYTSRTAFLADLVLDPPMTTGDFAGPPTKEEDWLTLSTIHSAKGCEWDVVHILHATDGNIPSDMATGSDEEIDEERRLLYVAMTRARDALHVYAPLRYYFRKRPLDDAHAYAQVSRFLDASVQDLMEQDVRTIPEDDPVANLAPITESVDAMLSGLFE